MERKTSACCDARPSATHPDGRRRGAPRQGSPAAHPHAKRLACHVQGPPQTPFIAHPPLMCHALEVLAPDPSSLTSTHHRLAPLLNSSTTIPYLLFGYPMSRSPPSSTTSSRPRTPPRSKASASPHRRSASASACLSCASTPTTGPPGCCSRSHTAALVIPTTIALPTMLPPTVLLPLMLVLVLVLVLLLLLQMVLRVTLLPHHPPSLAPRLLLLPLLHTSATSQW